MASLESPVLGLQRRIMLYVLVGLAVLFALIGYVARAALQRNTTVVMQERLTWARTVAREVDAVFAHVVPELERYAGYIAYDGGTVGEHQALILRGLYEHLRMHQEEDIPFTLALYSREGELAWGPPDGAAAAGGPPEPPFSRTLGTGEPYLSSTSPRLGPGHPAIVAAAPVPGPDGQPVGVLVAEVLPTRSLWRFATAMAAADGTFVLELVTPEGVVAASGPGGLFGAGEHVRLVEPLLALGEAGVVIHAAPVQGSATDYRDHVVAYAPLTVVPWGVLLEQPRDVALSLPRAVERQLLLVGLFALVAGLGLAWVTTRQVARPIEALTRTAQRMAAGDLDSPVDTSGPDEVGVLARSFETMRRELRESRDEINRWNRELERRVADRTRELEARNRELVALQAQRTALLRRVIGAQEDERKRVARDLHDEVGQFLTGLVLSLGTVRRAAEGREPELAGQLAALQDMATRAVEEVRRLVADLRPSVLDDLGLVEALRWYAAALGERAGLAVEVSARDLDGRLPPHLELVIFRVIQEALTNVARHARASRARVVVEATGGSVRATVADDGRGFDPDVVRSRRDGTQALGLLGMEERVRLAGGTFRLDASPGRGTTVAFTIPRTEGEPP